MGLLFILVVGAIAYFWYAGLISKRNAAREALSGIDVQLTLRAELIPNILAIAKRFLTQETDVLTRVTELRAEAMQPYDRGNAQQVAQHLAAAEQLGQAMGNLKIAVEAYPELTSSSTMIEAMRSYNEVEAQLSAARRFYNSAVTRLNNAVEIFPGNLIARGVGVEAMPFFQAMEGAAQPIDAAALLN